MQEYIAGFKQKEIIELRYNINDIGILNRILLLDNYITAEILIDNIGSAMNINNKSTIHKKLMKYSKNGLLKKIKDPEIISRILINKKSEFYGIGDKICEWCKIKTIILHKHHFPIEKRKGGNDIVNICPNCHSEYHFIKSNYFIITDKLRNMYNADYDKY